MRRSHARHAAPTHTAAAHRLRAVDPASLSRLRRARHTAIGLPRVPELWVVAMRVSGRADPKGLPDGRGRSGGRIDSTSAEQPVLGLRMSPSARPPVRQTALPVIDERLRGTKFVTLDSRSVLNSPEQTGMDFWSINPYVGCEFGCTYCYARFAHRYVVERAHRAGNLTDAELPDYRGPHGWEEFERRIFVKDQIPGALETDLRRLPPRHTVRMGTAARPY